MIRHLGGSILLLNCDKQRRNWREMISLKILSVMYLGQNADKSNCRSSSQLNHSGFRSNMALISTPKNAPTKPPNRDNFSRPPFWVGIKKANRSSVRRSLRRLEVLRPRKVKQCMLCGRNSAVLCLFKDREATEVGIGKENAPMGLSEAHSFG